jgi:tetratricopeptide (TPR) repeat protein
MDSKAVNQLRNEAKNLLGIEKLNKLQEAFKLAKTLFAELPNDEWNRRALAWVLIDMCKYYISIQDFGPAQLAFKTLDSISFNSHDDQIIVSQKSLLRPKVDTIYSIIQKAEELSKQGNNHEALSIFKNLISQNKLTELHHESYGWVIYRHIKLEENKLSSVEVRTFLRDYMNLKNERPSMLHSMILNFALSYSKSHSDFKFYSFFLLWNPENLRDDDFHDGTNQNGDKIPSLISRICREFVNTETIFDIDEILISKILNKHSSSDFNDLPF